MKKTISLCIVLVLVISVFNINVFATNSSVEVDIGYDGTFTFTTLDSTATNATRYKTIGWTLYNEDRTKSVVLMLEQTKQEPVGEYTRTYFEIDKKVLYDRIGAVDSAWRDELYEKGGTVFLDGIFTVFNVDKSGKVTYFGGLTDQGDKYWGRVYFHLYSDPKNKIKGIYDAETWKNPKPLKQYFGIPLEFKVNYKPPTTSEGKLTIKYFTETGVTLGTYNSEQKLVKGNTYNISPLPVNGYEFAGSKIAYDKVPSGDMSKIANYSINYTNPTYKDAYIYYYFKPKSTPPAGTGGTGVIKADTRGAEKFDVSKGIPSSEKVYVNIMGQSYMYDYHFSEVTGSIDYDVDVTKTYNLYWESKSGTFYHRHEEFYSELGSCDNVLENPLRCGGHDSYTTYSDVQTVTKTLTLTRTYSYWVIDHIAVYKIDNAVVTNGVLPDGKVTLTPVNYIVPTLSATQHIDHIIEPSTSTITLPSETVWGGTSKPSVPSYDLKAEAENLPDGERLGEITVRNDSVIFGGTTIMSDSYMERDTIDPLPMPVSPIVDKDTLYKSDIAIDGKVKNGTYKSTCTINYVAIDGSIGGSATNKANILVNDVVVHTPVYCDGGIYGDKGFNQEVYFDKTRATIVLGKDNYFLINTNGQHLDIPGYGERDYKSYIAAKQVKFPFDVYIDTTTADPSKFVSANTWYTIPMDKEKINIYVPTWVDEGNYTVEYRTLALNAQENDKTQEKANLDKANTIATDTSPVRVVGRVYGFKITDIENYPFWESVFRKSTGSAQHSGQFYYSGPNNQNGLSIGIKQPYTLPVMPGSHPTAKNQAIPTGYTFKFELETVGNNTGKYSAIAIYPTFYYVSKDGKTKQEVDLYYNEYFEGKNNKFVKIDNNTLNRKNAKTCTLGDPYRNVPKDAVKNTAEIIGVTESAFKTQSAKLGYFDFIVLTEKLRTYVGDVTNLPEGVDRNDALSSVQHWYGEYYLPNDLFVAPKGFDVAGYGLKNYGLNGKEDFWLKNGYIVVNFKIEVHDDIKANSFNKPKLTYGNGMANMWQIEGYSTTKKDANNVPFQLNWGDIVFYDIDRKATEDYWSKGTH